METQLPADKRKTDDDRQQDSYLFVVVTILICLFVRTTLVKWAIPAVAFKCVSTPASALQLEKMKQEREPRTEFFKSGIKYADPQDQDPLALATRPADLMTLDPDADGTQTAAWGETHDLPYDRNTVAVLNVFGKPMSRSFLECSDAGRELLRIAEQNRKGNRRDFWEAIKDVRYSDLPYLGMIASVEGSYRDAVEVSNAMKKMQNGEELTDDELIETRLFMAKNEYESKGTLGSKIADIVWQAPGGIFEFYGCVAYIATALVHLWIRIRKRKWPCVNSAFVSRAMGVAIFILLILIGTYLARMTNHVLAGYIVGAVAFAALGTLWKK